MYAVFRAIFNIRLIKIYLLLIGFYLQLLKMNLNYLDIKEGNEHSSSQKGETGLYEEYFSRSKHDANSVDMIPNLKFGIIGNNDDRSLSELKSQVEALRLELSRLSKENSLLRTAGPLCPSPLPPGPTDSASTSLLPSEFSSLLTETLTHLLPSWLASFLPSPFLFADLVQDLFIEVEAMVCKMLEYKVSKLAAFLGVGLDQRTDGEMKGLFRRYCGKLRSLGGKEMELGKRRVSDMLGRTINAYLQMVRQGRGKDGFGPSEAQIADYYLELERATSTEEFEEVLRALHEICLFMKLNRPALSLNLSQKDKRVYYCEKFNKQQAICIDGFASHNVITWANSDRLCHAHTENSDLRRQIISLNEIFCGPFGGR